jgi:hypothetical protein
LNGELFCLFLTLHNVAVQFARLNGTADNVINWIIESVQTVLARPVSYSLVSFNRKGSSGDGFI